MVHGTSATSARRHALVAAPARWAFVTAPEPHFAGDPERWASRNAAEHQPDGSFERWASSPSAGAGGQARQGRAAGTRPS
jgi:hypothetical protein